MGKPLKVKALVSKIKKFAEKCRGFKYLRVKEKSQKNWWNGILVEYQSGLKESLICLESEANPKGCLNIGDDEANYFVITCPENMLKLINAFEKRTRALELLSKGGCDLPEKHYADIACLALIEK